MKLKNIDLSVFQQLNPEEQNLKVFSRSFLGIVFAKIAKALGLALDVRVAGRQTLVTMPKSSYVKLLAKTIAHDIPYLDEQSIKRAVKEAVDKLSSKHKEQSLQAQLALLQPVIAEMGIEKLIDSAIALEDKEQSLTGTEARQVYSEVREYLLEQYQADKSHFNMHDAFVAYLQEHPHDTAYLIRLITRINGSPMKEAHWVRTFLKDIAATCSAMARENPPPDPSAAPREAGRTPKELLVDLLAYLEQHPLPQYEALVATVKSHFITHDTTLSAVSGLLEQTATQYHGTPLAAKCLTLRSQLLKELHHTRMHDNIYGRVFDSAFVMDLVQDPPSEVQQAMSQMSQGLARQLSTMNLSPKQRNEINDDIKTLLQSKDPRFWFPAVPALEQIRDGDEDALSLMIRFLEEPKETGYECIAVPYLMVKLANILKARGMPPSWMRRADRTYNFHLMPRVRKIRVVKAGSPTVTRGAGITLQHQPPLADEEWMQPSVRPTTVRKPNLRVRWALPSAKKAMKKALDHEVPWASGMSGSTNISMHAWEHFNKTETIDAKATFLGVVMFLVFDGGHSIHEPMWAASRINRKLRLGFDIGTTPKIEDYIANYEMLRDMYHGDLKKRLEDALESSFDQTIQYFHEHSFYAKATDDGESA